MFIEVCKCARHANSRQLDRGPPQWTYYPVEARRAPNRKRNRNEVKGLLRREKLFSFWMSGQWGSCLSFVWATLLGLHLLQGFLLDVQLFNSAPWG